MSAHRCIGLREVELGLREKTIRERGALVNEQDITVRVRERTMNRRDREMRAREEAMTRREREVAEAVQVDNICCLFAGGMWHVIYATMYFDTLILILC